MWKSSTNENYPLRVTKLASNCKGVTTRGMSKENVVEPVTVGTFIGDATRLWN